MIEKILIDQAGNAVATVIEVGGFLDTGNDEVVIMLDDRMFMGSLTVGLMEGQLESLPVSDD